MICDIIVNQGKRGDLGLYCVKPEVKSYGSVGMAPLPEEAEWGPAVDVGETDEEIFMVAEFPGVKKEDLKVTQEEDVISIQGNKKKEEDGDYLLEERNQGYFQRSFILPKEVDKGKIKAEFKDGILKIRMPKKEKVRSRKIEVR